MTATYEIECVNSIVSDWNEDALEYMIENWDNIA